MSRAASVRDACNTDPDPPHVLPVQARPDFTRSWVALSVPDPSRKLSSLCKQFNKYFPSPITQDGEPIFSGPATAEQSADLPSQPSTPTQPARKRLRLTSSSPSREQSVRQFPSRVERHQDFCAVLAVTFRKVDEVESKSTGPSSADFAELRSLITTIAESHV